MLPNEQERSFKRAFAVIKPFMRSFSSACDAHVDCQLAAINAFRSVFGCNVRICLFHQNQAVWRAVARFGLAGHYNSVNFPKLHVWIRRLFALPFLSEVDIVSNFTVLFEQDAVSWKIHVEDCCIEQFKNLVNYYKSFWLTKISVKSGATTPKRNGQTTAVKDFTTVCARQYKLHTRICMF